MKVTTVLPTIKHIILRFQSLLTSLWCGVWYSLYMASIVSAYFLCTTWRRIFSVGPTRKQTIDDKLRSTTIYVVAWTWIDSAAALPFEDKALAENGTWYSVIWLGAKNMCLTSIQQVLVHDPLSLHCKKFYIPSSFPGMEKSEGRRLQFRTCTRKMYIVYWIVQSASNIVLHGPLLRHKSSWVFVFFKSFRTAAW